MEFILIPDLIFLD